MDNYTITITRQFGSLGRPIARKLAELLDIEYFDRDIVEKAAKEMGEYVSVISEEEERAENGFSWMKHPFGLMTSGRQDEIFKIEQEIIENYAAKQSCIVVGRCSDYILREFENTMHIYIYAPLEQRLRNCVEILKMDPKDARNTIKDVDKMRDNYHKNYAGYLPGDVEHKHLMIDSSLLGVDKTAYYLAQLVSEKFHL